MVIFVPDLAEQLRLEQQALLKADADIDEGRKRLYEQEGRLARLRDGGRDVRHASRLADLFKQTLGEWERHRILIEQRVDYLQKQVAALGYD